MSQICFRLSTCLFSQASAQMPWKLQLLIDSWRINLDASVNNNYWPVPNLTVLNKIIKKAVFQQMHNYLIINGWYDIFPSGFQPHNSTGTTLVKVLNDIHLNKDSGKMFLLLLLYFSAAFHMVNNNVQLHWLENWVGLSGTALNWFQSYLNDRDYFVSVVYYTSEQIKMTCGVNPPSSSDNWKQQNMFPWLCRWHTNLHNHITRRL